MFRPNPIAFSLICGFSLAGCASTAHLDAEAQGTVEPLLALSHGGFNAEQMYRMGRSFEDQKRYDQAEAAYREALKRNPLLVEAYTGLGMALAAQKRYDDAVRQFRAAVVLSPESANARNNLGYVYLLAGRNAEAVQALEEAARLDRTNVKASENLRLARERLAHASATVPTVASPAKPGSGSDSSPNKVQVVQVEPQVFELKLPSNPAPLVAKPLSPVVQPTAAKAPHAAASARLFGLEVSNGNGVTGMAKRVSGHLRERGIVVTRLTNDRPFEQRHTVIHYRQGYEVEALALKATLQPEVQTVQSDELKRHINVRLVLGKDAMSDTALVVPENSAIVASR